MNLLLKFLHAVQLFEITPSRIEKWTLHCNADMLVFSLKKGLFKEKILSIAGLKNVLGAAAIPHLLPWMTYEPRQVSEAAMLAVRMSDTGRRFQKEILQAEKYWMEREKDEAERQAILETRDWKRWNGPDQLVDKSKMENFQFLKAQLRTPISSSTFLSAPRRRR